MKKSRFGAWKESKFGKFITNLWDSSKNVIKGAIAEHLPFGDRINKVVDAADSYARKI